MFGDEELLMILLGKRIKELRTQHNLTQAQFAEKIGVAKSTVVAYECNSRQPSYEALIRIAHAFGMHTDTLLLDGEECTLDVRGLTEEQKAIIKNLISYFRSEKGLCSGVDGV